MMAQRRGRGTPPTFDDLLTPAEAAELVGVAVYTIRKWGRQGRIPVYRLGGTLVRYRRSDLEALIAPDNRSGGAA